MDSTEIIYLIKQWQSYRTYSKKHNVNTKPAYFINKAGAVPQQRNNKDLVQFTPDNVINGHISYIARKTRKERVDSIEVPLNNTATNILKKYWDGRRYKGKLLPFLSPQKYNDCIKMIFLLCGLTRKVTIWNSTTGREEQHPLNELASSHLARRTFIGNLYKKVQDPNMIGKLSGHVEGSKAFARYRTIDDEMMKSMVDMLE